MTLPLFLRRAAFLAALLAALFLLTGPASAAPWKFAVIGDGQGGRQPDQVNGVATDVVEAVARRLAAAKVNLVIAVGDLTESFLPDTPDAQTALESQFATWRRAMAPVYSASIAVLPLRGNHDASAGPHRFLEAAWLAAFPETRSPPPGFTIVSQKPGAAGFTYAFTHSGALFLNLDLYKDFEADRMSRAWVASILTSSSNSATHCFVLAHEGLAGRYHADALPSDDRPAFVKTLVAGNVRTYICGHDHQYYHGALTDSASRFLLAEVISAPTCRKFYMNRADFAGYPKGEFPLAWIGDRYGYCIYTLDGPQARCDFYASATDCSDNSSDAADDNFDFTLQDSWAWSSNGPQFTVSGGASYAGLTHTILAPGFRHTTATILSGTNSGENKLVSFGWNPIPPALPAGRSALSDAFVLSGLNTAFSSPRSATYALSLSFSASGLPPADLAAGKVYLAACDASGRWTNAVDANVGGKKRFVPGPYKAGYELGDYGVDPAAGIAWAVINYCNRIFTVLRD